MNETGDSSTAAGSETPTQPPQSVDVPQAETGPRRDGWFHGAVRVGIIAAVVVLVAGAFFSIGWFTSPGGEHDGYSEMMNGTNQQMHMRQWDGSQGGTDQRGSEQRQRDSGRKQGMVVPQQGQGQGQIAPRGQSQSNGQSNQSGQPDQPGRFTQPGYLGVGVETVTSAVQQQDGSSRSNGALVASIDGSGPAAQAGIRQGDVIVSIDGVPVSQGEDVVNLIAQKQSGDTVSVTVERNGQSLTFRVTLAERPDSLSG